MDNLRDCVHAGIRTACADCRYRMPRDGTKRTFYRILDSTTMGLRLPTAKRTAVVFDSERDARHPWPQKKLPPGR
jgi:hypothetical protein